MTLKRTFPMARLVREFARLAQIDLGVTFDGSPWARPLSGLYRHFNKDIDLTIAYMTKAIAYFESKGLSYTPHTLWKDLPMIDKWLKEKKPLIPNF